MLEDTPSVRPLPVANAFVQLRILESPPQVPDFEEQLTAHQLPTLKSDRIEVLQINVGKLCNQTCQHCHVDAGPKRREVMSHEVALACLNLLRHTDIPTLDITGGAPEMNPHFRWLVSEARQLGRQVIDRCNLTILVAPGYEDLPEFLAQHQVEIVASLPCYLEENVDRQRGNHVFRRSVEALRRLNALGYGVPNSRLPLNLVFNPIGPTLPPRQDQLEASYRLELKSRYGIEFNRLYTITNMPISRFLDQLLHTGHYEAYMEKLVAAFNPSTVAGLMCRSMISVDWQGNLFDCDFNQMLELRVSSELPGNILGMDAQSWAQFALRPIMTGKHCFGCTAGAGSSCQGSLTPS